MDFTLTEEQKTLQESARALAVRHFSDRAYTWEESGEYPFEHIRVLADHGLSGMILDPEHGGQGASLLDAVLVMEEIAKVCPHTGDAFHVTNFGAICEVAEFASDALRKQVLPELLRGDAILSVGISEPEAGSAATELKTHARRSEGEVLINGQKIWNSEGPHASWWVVWVRFLDSDKKRNIGAVVVPESAPGFARGRTSYFMPGVQHCTLHFDDCRVPKGNILVEDDGFRSMMSIFNIERLGNATRSIALGQAALDLAIAHAKDRHQFGQSLASFQGLRWKIADAHVRLDAARLALHRAAANAELHDGVPTRHDSSVAKLQANTAGFDAANEALQILGALGYDQESPVNYLFRRTRGWMIAGGTTEMLKNQVARGLLDE